MLCFFELSLQVSRIVFMWFFKKWRGNKVFFIFGNSSIKLTIDILNNIVDLLTPVLLLWCYTIQTTFFLLLLIIVLKFWIMFTTSSNFASILVFSSISVLSFSSFTNDSSIFYFIFSLVFWFDLVVALLTSKSCISNKKNIKKLSTQIAWKNKQQI